MSSKKTRANHIEGARSSEDITKPPHLTGNSKSSIDLGHATQTVIETSQDNIYISTDDIKA